MSVPDGDSEGLLKMGDLGDIYKLLVVREPREGREQVTGRLKSSPWVLKL